MATHPEVKEERTSNSNPYQIIVWYIIFGRLTRVDCATITFPVLKVRYRCAKIVYLTLATPANHRLSTFLSGAMPVNARCVVLDTYCADSYPHIP